MGLELNNYVIGMVLEERRETEEQEKILKGEIDSLKKQREELAAGDPAQNEEQIRSLDIEIEKLGLELEKQIERQKNACMIARTFTAGD